MSEAFDLAEGLQTPVIVMSDLDLGMNDHMSEPFQWDDNKKNTTRGKVLSAEELEKFKDWGRYRDADNDGIPYRTLPGGPSYQRILFYQGSSHDEYARYTEDSDTYIRIMERLQKKWRQPKMVPSPEVLSGGNALGMFSTAHRPTLVKKQETCFLKPVLR